MLHSYDFDVTVVQCAHVRKHAGTDKRKKQEGYNSDRLGQVLNRNQFPSLAVLLFFPVLIVLDSYPRDTLS